MTTTDRIPSYQDYQRFKHPSNPEGQDEIACEMWVESALNKQFRTTQQ